MKRRTRARELALQFLYSLDVRGTDGRPDLERFLRAAKASVEVRRFATELIDGVRQHQPAIDARIRALAQNWTLERIARVDRNVLRLAAFELLYSEGTPAPVVLDEAIELGKRYSTAQSGKFINGILDRMHRDGRAPLEPPMDGTPA